MGPGRHILVHLYPHPPKSKAGADIWAPPVSQTTRVQLRLYRWCLRPSSRTRHPPTDAALEQGRRKHRRSGDSGPALQQTRWCPFPPLYIAVRRIHQRETTAAMQNVNTISNREENEERENIMVTAAGVFHPRSRSVVGVEPWVITGSR